jgi:hypothetical protein
MMKSISSKGTSLLFLNPFAQAYIKRGFFTIQGHQRSSWPNPMIAGKSGLYHQQYRGFRSSQVMNKKDFYSTLGVGRGAT